MDEQKLRETLAQLHTELEQAQSVDPNTRELLSHLMQDIQGVLVEESPTGYSGLAKRLANAVQQLESAHPNLVLTIGNVLDHLANV